MIRSTIIWLIFISFFYPVPEAGAQSILPQLQNSPSQPDTVKEPVQPIPLNKINSAAAEAYNLINRAKGNQLSTGERNYISARADSLMRKINNTLTDTVPIDYEGLSFRELEKMENSILLHQNAIEELQTRIDGHLDLVQNRIRTLQKNRKRWDQTLSESDPDEMSQTLVRRINRVLTSNDSVRVELQNDIDFLFSESDKLTSLQVRIEQFRSEVSNQGMFTSAKVFRRDMPPIWMFFSQSDSQKKHSLWGDVKMSISDDSLVMVNRHSRRIVLLFILFGILGAIVYYLKLTVKEVNVQQHKVRMGLYIDRIFSKPVEVAMLIGFYLLHLMIPELPVFYATVVALLFVFAVTRLAVGIMPQGFRKFLIGFAAAYILLRFYDLFFDHHQLSRLILLLAQVIALVYLLLFIKVRRMMLSKKRSAFNYILKLFSVFYIGLLTIALAGNVAGAVSFSGYISSAVVNSGFMMITTYVGFQISVALFYMFLSSSVFKSSFIVQQQLEYIFTKAYRLFRWFFVFAWIYIALDQFHIGDSFFDGISAFLHQERAIGEAKFKLINIILFVFVIWLSLIISRFVRHILKEEVFTRVTVEQGIPGTITMLLRIVLITIGFMLAAAAAGMQLSSLTIIIGAFSVGIGFGLQNIFNNLVSGLILMFERPIKEGDIVEVNALLGIVKSIGIRSSVVRTYDGAEVIVPNGMLISNELINWSLSDKHRRADIRVGVAYGTDPDKVLQILLRVAEENPRTMNDPTPRAFFLGFGDSSLDFRLLAWADLDNRLEMESELKVAINRELKEAGIEIPFPQRDLHIRSVDPEAGKQMK